VYKRQRQHGYIASVGFHLYTQLLAEAVRQLRSHGELPLADSAPALDKELSLPVNVDLPLAASIPADYVADKGMRLHLYRRMADIRSLGEVDALQEEFSDRFGEPPAAVLNLLFQIKIKLLAEDAGLASVSSENGQLVLRFPDGQVPPDLPLLGAEVRVGKTALWVPYNALTDWRSFLLDILAQLKPAVIEKQ
jgi:transcription-repair coupling factor (superfamily II helicase)